MDLYLPAKQAVQVKFVEFAVNTFDSYPALQRQSAAAGCDDEYSGQGKHVVASLSSKLLLYVPLAHEEQFVLPTCDLK